MKNMALIPQTPVAITIIVFFRFQMATLAVTVSGQTDEPRHRTYMRTTIKREEAEIVIFPNIWKTKATVPDNDSFRDLAHRMSYSQIGKGSGAF
jgi:hypothetical protein